MTIVFEDSLQGGGSLSGRVSTSGHTWTTAGVAMSLDASGASIVGANGGRGAANDVSIPAGTLTFEARILGSSATSSAAAWTARFGAANAAATEVFQIALVHLAGTIYVREYTDLTSFTPLFDFPRVAATVYDLRVEFDGANYTVFVDDVQMYGPVAPGHSPVGMNPMLYLTNSGSGTSNRVYAQYVKIDLAAPPAAFWTNRVKTAEIIQ